MFTLAQGYSRTGMSAYVELQQREFADEAVGYTAVKHQAEVGTGYFDQVATALNPDSGTLALKGRPKKSSSTDLASAPGRCTPSHRPGADSNAGSPLHLAAGPMASLTTTRSTFPDRSSEDVRTAQGPEDQGHHASPVRRDPHPEALAFIAKLDGASAGRRAELLAARRERSKRIAAGEPVDFLAETASVREDAAWQVAAPAPGLEDRRCEITGPTSRKMSINALNSGARVWMADFEDATAPSWFNVIDGQLNLFDAIRGNLDFTDESGKEYKVGAQTPTIVVRPRGWRLCEKHLTIDGRPLPASLIDFGLFFFHNAQALIDAGAGPYFYLPKLESHLEARLWNDIFVQAQRCSASRRAPSGPPC